MHGDSEATRQKVIETSKRLHYRPHRASRNLLKNRQGVIGVLTSCLYMIPWAAIHAMLMQARQYDQVLSFEAFSPEDPELPLFIREKVVDGLIIYETIPPPIEQALARYRIPAVFVNTSLHRPCAINMDESGAIKQVAKHLAQQGRTRFALVVKGNVGPYEAERTVALQRACAALGLAAPQTMSFPEGLDRAIVEQRLTEMLADASACDALIVPHVWFVSLAYKVCARLGRRLPKELVVVSMVDNDMLRDFDPPVSAFDLPEIRLGELAVEMLNGLIAGKKSADEVLLKYPFINRQAS